MTSALQTEEIAARWLARRAEESWSEADQAALDAWLDAAPAHRVAYWRLEYGWEKAGRMAALGVRTPPRRSLRSRAAPRGWGFAVGIGLAACLALAVIAAPGMFGMARYTTEVGQRQVIPLADGSRVELNTGTRLRAAVNDKGRTVWLDRGEAYFEVAHDPSRPFMVHAGARTITVLGTKFSVRRDGGRVEVAVVEGRVKVEDAAPSPAASPTFVTGGDIVVAEGDSTLLAVKSVERVAEDLSWRHGRLTFDQATLAEAVAEFNRYNHKQLVITDPDAAALRIGGSFEASNVDAFTRLLQRGFGLRVKEEGERVEISS